MKILILTVVFGFSLGCRSSTAHLSRVTPDAELIKSALQTYYIITGELPTASQGLAALVERPVDLPPATRWTQLVSEVPVDPWNNKYEYAPLSGGDEPGFEIRSLGPDGIRSEDDPVTIFRIGPTKSERSN